MNQRLNSAPPPTHPLTTATGCVPPAPVRSREALFTSRVLLVRSHSNRPCLPAACFTPANRRALKTAVDACLKETADGSCPTFSATKWNGADGYGTIGCWNTGQVKDMGYSQ